jgi:predicted cupin superfamily sugar epimerase
MKTTTELTVTEIVAHFQMQPHPEGGYYKESYRSNESIERAALPIRFAGDRNFATAIYFLLEQGNFSAFHKIQSDETWHFYAGQCLEIFVLQENQDLQIIRLGSNIHAGEIFQATVPAGAWFASRPAKETKFSLVGCTVSPGFDFQDFELAQAKKLSIAHPKYQPLIIELCRS